MDYTSATLPREGRQGPAPKPAAKLERDQSALWRKLWSSPMATMWSEFDVEALTRYVQLCRSDAALSVPAVMAEVRQIEDRFGLNPKGRQSLRWQLPKAEPSEGKIAPVDDLADYSYLRTA